MEAVRYCTMVFVCFLVCASVAFAESDSAKQPITMLDALSWSSQSVKNVRWFGRTSSLYGETVESKEGGEFIVAWRPGSSTPEVIGSGAYGAVSPNGEQLLSLGDGEWQLTATTSGSVKARGSINAKEPRLFASPRWSHDSRYVAWVEWHEDELLGQHDSEKESASQDFPVVDIGAEVQKRIDRNKGFGLPVLRIIDTDEDNAETMIEFDGGRFVYYVDWGPGNRLYFVEMQGYWSGRRAFTALKWLDPSDASSITQLYRIEDGFIQSAAPQVSPDGKWVAMALDVDNQRWDDFSSLVVVNSTTGDLRRLTHDKYVVAGDYRWANDGRVIYFIGRQGGLDQVFRVDLDGRSLIQMTDAPRRHDNLELSADGRYLSYQTSDPFGRKDIRTLDLRSNRENVVATIDDPTDEYQLARFHHVTWRTPDDVDLYGFLFLPPDKADGERAPLLVDIHGGGPGSPLYLSGPMSIGLAQSPLEWHAWACAGYVVFVPDMRSSGEYGPTIATARHESKTWDSQSVIADAADVESGINWVIEQGYGTSSRIVGFGHSAGGVRLHYLLTQTDLFAAAIIHDPVMSGNLPFYIEMMSGRNTGAGFDESQITNGIKLRDNPALYLGGFMFDGYKIRTPTLIMVGNPELGAIPPLSSEVLFTILRQYETPTRMLRYLEDGHFASTVESAVHRTEAMRSWIEDHLQK